MHSRSQWFFYFLLTAFILMGAGCAHIRHGFDRAGRGHAVINTGFTGDWWDYYERGRSFAEDGLSGEAIADFRRAIEGREQDQWRAVTSGSHRIDYFPHRELGVVYFQRREYDKAIAELEYSIDNAPSAKAHHFLNRARAARIDRYDLDRAAPELNLEASSAEEVTNGMIQVVRGVASDDNYIAAITIGDRQVEMELAARRKIFRAEAELNEGGNRIRIVATDLAGKSTEQYRTVYCDRHGPRIEIEELLIENGRVILQGSISDDKGLASLRLNNERWPITGHAAGYNFKLTLPDDKITLVAADRAGNITRAVIREHESDMEQAGSSPYANGTTPDQADAGKPVVADFPLPPAPVGSGAAVDGDPPHIRVTGPGPDEETFADEVLLEGMVSDASLLIYISINGEPVLNRKGRKVYFSQLKKLAPGANRFHIVAADEYGNKVDRTIRVHRRIPAIRRMGSRMDIAVLPFAQSGETSQPGLMLHDRMIDAFMEQGRFRIVEKSRIESLLREQGGDSSLPLAPEQAVHIGKRAAAQAVLTGSVIESPRSMEVVGQLIDVETGTILAVNDVYGEDNGPAFPDSLLDGLALKFGRDLPLAEGRLLEVRGDEVLIDAGLDRQIKPAMQLICYREEPPTRHPLTGRPIVVEPQILAILKVEEVDKDSCTAVVLHRYSALMAADRVIAR